MLSYSWFRKSHNRKRQIFLMHLAKYHHKKQTLFLRKSIPLGQKNHSVACGGSANCRIWCDTTRGWWVRAAQGAAQLGDLPTHWVTAAVQRLPAPCTVSWGHPQTPLRLPDTPSMSMSAQAPGYRMCVWALRPPDTPSVCVSPQDGDGKTEWAASTCLCCPH